MVYMTDRVINVIATNVWGTAVVVTCVRTIEIANIITTQFRHQVIGVNFKFGLFLP